MLKTAIIMSVILVLSACSASKLTRVKCDGRLEPINRPAVEQQTDRPSAATKDRAEEPS